MKNTAIPWLLLASSNATLTIPKDVIAHLRLSAAQSLRSHQFGSYVALIRADGKVEYDTGTPNPRMKIPVDTVLILHTHPSGASPIPTSNDIETSVRLRVPDCVVTLERIVCVLADGKVVEQ